MNEKLIAKNIVEKLKFNGHQAVFAGGAVRDILLGVKPKDYDVATSATPDEVEAIFHRTIPVGKQFGVIIVLESGHQVEVATFREDSKESDGRRPDSVEFSSMEADAMRRDLTINGLFLDPTTDEIFDFVGGKADILNKVVRFIGDPQERIDEDKLRMLRAIRFAARLDFKIDGLTKDVIKKNAKFINQVSKERIKAELDKMLLCKKPSVAFELLREVGLLDKPFVLPAVAKLWEQEQGVKWHSEGSVGKHTMMVLDACRNKTDDIETLWAALLHDVGKPATSVVKEDGGISCHGHDKLGAEMADEILKGLRSSNEERERVVALIGDHMKAGMIQEMKKSTLRRFISQPHIDQLVNLFHADCEGSIPIDSNREDHKLDGVKFLVEAIETIDVTEERELPPPLISGYDLINLGLKPGPQFKDILREIADMQLEGEIETFEEALSEAKKLIG